MVARSTVQRSTLQFPWVEQRASFEVLGGGLRPQGLDARRRSRRRLHHAVGRPLHRAVDDRRSCATRGANAGLMTRDYTRLRRRARVRGSRTSHTNATSAVVRRDGGQPRRRHRRALRRGLVAVPQALTDYIKGREGYDYSHHGRADNTHAEFVPDEVIDRFCVLGDVQAHRDKLSELRPS